ncbi:SMI1/KNR4 family protein [Photobacterium kishitanii]|uniref:hypothetical protein n=1 Tax=Photobacterium kishitanii TaxID=318456 RepID=UPI0009BFA4C5|nr:hypothetical protein [Photobacterium kishitanii]PSW71501.1 SMI1/KNR4 family protein [Photobacterium kishitanii]
MNISNKAADSLRMVWLYPNSALNKKIDVSLYKELSEEIPDDILQITEIIPEKDLEEVHNAFSPYMDNSNITPFLMNYGNVVTCIGIGEHNDGFIYCYDADFGCFLLEQNIEFFLSKLVDV